MVNAGQRPTYYMIRDAESVDRRNMCYGSPKRRANSTYSPAIDVIICLLKTLRNIPFVGNFFAVLRSDRTRASH